ncbi:Plant protein of unknown function (DUF247) [Quillaja saponaria]|uniref:Uncharacterized protein n=1 Tax=Quillaja saponaria TaxID=32244 RepID=A0AAD7PKZ0_QUISA|nr:Plant protein of unknown function (DUF247) [Quillaja saponaria]
METCKVSCNHDHEWVIDLSRTLEEDLESHQNTSSFSYYDDHDDELASTISIFNVPKALLSSKPEAYTPQVIALGPYHHRRLELFEMERCKITSAKQVQKNMKPGTKFQDLVHQISTNDVHTRDCYHRYLDFDQETLAWLFAIDASFLLEYLQTFCSYSSDNYKINNEGSTTSTRSSVMGRHLMMVDYTRRRTVHQEILRDVIMLENQIPLFLIREDLLYDYIVVPELQFPQEIIDQEQKEKDTDNKEDNEEVTCWFASAIYAIIKLIWLINWAPVHFIIKICKSKVAMLLITLPLKVLVTFFKFRGKTALASSAENVVEEFVNSTGSVANPDESPLVEELAIPSVRELSKIGVKFRPTKGGLSTIQFDKSSGIFRLPVIHLNDNSNVVLRNLVAYEASAAPEAMVFTRYTELMNGIIDTEKDVRILREAGVLINRMKSDKEVASLWNEMTKSIRVTKVPILDRAIESANEYYSTSWKVKTKTTMKKYVYGSWPCLTFLAANMLLCLTTVEAVCSVYHCSKFLRVF